MDLTLTKTWDDLCDQYRGALPFDASGLHVQVYAGYTHAVLEIAQGLARLFTNKKTIALIDREEPFFANLAAAFSAEGYTVKNITPQDESTVAEWLPGVQADLLFVLSAEDDPVTGRLADHGALWAALKDKRVFRISVSHRAHHFTPLERPGFFDVRVLSLSTERALVVAGERCRVSPAIAPILPWQMEKADVVSSQLRTVGDSESQVLKKSVLDFEARLPEGFMPFFTTADPRLYDRAVIYHPEIDGSALIDELAKRSGRPLAAPGFETFYEASSPCRWQDQRLADWLMSRGLSEEQVRGLVLIEASEISLELSRDLSEAAAHILKLQNG